METQISIPETLGCIELGIILSAMIYGLMCVQCYNYHQLGFKDKMYIHLLQLFVIIVETTHMAFIIVSLYTTTVNRFGNAEAILEATWSISFSVFLAMLVNCPVQSFLAYKIRNMSRSWALTIFSWVGSLFRLITGLALSILAVRVGRIDLFEKKYQWLMVCNLVMGASVDIWNAGWLCYYLYWEGPKFSATRNLIHKLIIWTIETGIITSLSVLLTLITLLALPNSTFWVFFMVITPRLYSNSLFANLNGRAGLRSAIAASDLANEGVPGIHTHGHVGVEVHVDVLTISDAHGACGHEDIEMHCSNNSEDFDKRTN